MASTRRPTCRRVRRRDDRHHCGVPHGAGRCRGAPTVDHDETPQVRRAVGGEPPGGQSVHGDGRPAGEPGRLHSLGGDHHVACGQHTALRVDAGPARRGRADRLDRHSGPHVRQAVGELLGEPTHPALGQCRAAEREGAQQQAHEVGGGGPVGIDHHAGDEAVEDPAQVSAHPEVVKSGRHRRVASGHGDLGTGEHGRQPPAQPPQVAEVQQPAAQRVDGEPRRTARVTDHAQPPIPVPARAHQHAGVEGGQGQRVDVHPASDGRVGRVEHLETTVDDEAVDVLAGDPAPHVVLGLQQDHLATGLLEPSRAPEPGKAGPHHDDVGVHDSTLGQENLASAAGRRKSMPSDQIRWVMIGPRMPPVTRRCSPTTRPTTAAARTSSGMPLVATTSA